MADDFMDYMLYFNEDEDDEPQTREKIGCGCLPFVLICLFVPVTIYLLCH